MYKGQFCLNSGIHLTEVLAQTLWLLDRLRRPGLICSKANEFKKWRCLRSPHETQSCGTTDTKLYLAGQEFSRHWWAGSVPVQKEQVDRKWPTWLHCRGNMEFPFSGVNRTWPNSSFSVLGLLTVSWRVTTTCSSWHTEATATQQLTQRGWIGQLSKRGILLESGDAVKNKLNVFLLN